MYNKTNTLRTSSSTLITSSPYLESARSQKTRTQSSEKVSVSDWVTIDVQKKENPTTQPDFVKKEKVVKKHISFSEIKEEVRQSLKNPPAKKITINDKSKSLVLKKGFIINDNHPSNETKKSCIKNKSSGQKKKAVKFVDQVNSVLNEFDEEVSVSAKPLAQVVNVESYKNYLIYSKVLRNEESNTEEGGTNKTVCECSCIVF
jgi:hypothetical protein